MTDEDAPEVAAALRRVLVGWGRRYASAALLVAVLGLVVAAFPTRSPVLARFDATDGPAPVSRASTPPSATTTLAPPAVEVGPTAPTAPPVVDTQPALDPTPATIPAPPSPTDVAPPTTTATATVPPTTSPPPPRPTTTTTTCTLGALGVCAA